MSSATNPLCGNVLTTLFTREWHNLLAIYYSFQETIMRGDPVEGAWVYIVRCRDGSAQSFQRITDAIAAERQIKGWSRAKKEALIAGDFDRLVLLARSTKDRLKSGELK